MKYIKLKKLATLLLLTASLLPAYAQDGLAAFDPRSAPRRLLSATLRRLSPSLTEGDTCVQYLQKVNDALAAAHLAATSSFSETRAELNTKAQETLGPQENWTSALKAVLANLQETQTAATQGSIKPIDERFLALMRNVPPSSVETEEMPIQECAYYLLTETLSSFNLFLCASPELLDSVTSALSAVHLAVAFPLEDHDSSVDELAHMVYSRNATWTGRLKTIETELTTAQTAVKDNKEAAARKFYQNALIISEPFLLVRKAYRDDLRKTRSPQASLDSARQQLEQYKSDAQSSTAPRGLGSALRTLRDEN